jgi:hypothetical protein
MNDYPVTRAMFHTVNGLYFEKHIDFSYTGYTAQEAVNQSMCFKIRVHFTETIKNREISDGRVECQPRQQIFKSVELDSYTFASVMASMSARGETTETFQEALKFLQELPYTKPQEPPHE